jgi:hypothetical protein
VAGAVPSTGLGASINCAIFADVRHPHKTSNEMVLVIKPIFKHHPCIESTVHHKHTTVIRKRKDLMDSFENNKVLARTIGLFVAVI